MKTETGMKNKMKRAAAVCAVLLFMMVMLPGTVFATQSTSTPNTGTGNLYVVGYTVLNSAGTEVQKVAAGEKCQIVVALRDGRFTEVPPPAVDDNGNVLENGNIVNVKLTSTSSFSTPSFGDIKQTSPNADNANKELAYAIIFNDITYLGGDNKLSFDIAYVNAKIAVPLQNISVGISQCYDAAKDTSAKPSVMVKESSIGDKASVNAGETFALTLTSYNTSKTSGITDVTTSVSLPSSLTLASGSNVALNSSVAAGGSFSNTFSLQALSGAETGVANITVNYSFYIAGSEAPLTSSQVITVPIVQPDRFSFTSMDTPTDMYVGEEGTVTLNFVNKGKGTLYNLTAEISGNIDAPGQTQYIGNLNSGTQGSVDFSILTQTAGTVSGVITLTYEDVNGAEKKVTREYSMNVSEAPVSPEMPIGPMDPGAEMPAPGFPWWGWALIGVGVLAVVIIVIKLVKKRKAKRLALELAEDDEDEDF